MRIWTLHPKFLDTKGLVACWRETLLAKHVLEGKTRGYKNHSQLIRFKKQSKPLNSINQYLEELYRESQIRGFKFDKNKIGTHCKVDYKIMVTQGQVDYEFNHLQKKLWDRDDDKYLDNKVFVLEDSILVNPIFEVIEGEQIEEWEKV